PGAERLAERRRRLVGAGQPERAILRQHGDQLTALERAALVDDAELEVPDAGVQREAEQQHLQRRRHDERDREPAVPSDLPQLLQGERPEAPAEERAPDAPHAFTYIRR